MVRIPSVSAASPSISNAFPIQNLLAREFSSPDLSYLVLDLKSNLAVASNWKAGEQPIPIGSLVKPFTALAYAEAHGYRFPEHICMAGTCWLPRGHGRLDLVHAVAMSCNSYFTALAEDVTPAQTTEIAHRFGLSGPPADATASELAGQHGEWRESPLALARAYAELLSRRQQPGVSLIAEGMRQSAQNGTAAGIARVAPNIAVLAKTGTAPCTHTPNAPGDGFVIAAWPADEPRWLLLAREHGHPGAQAAVVAGEMIRELERAR